VDKIHITTPIYYANGKPHLGHAYTMFLTDAYTRYYKLRSYETRLTTGLDEHGLKIERAALKHGKEPQQFVDQIATEFQDTWKRLDIIYDDFIRTSEPRHKKIANQVWKRMEENGDIYLDEYKGLYCVDCEQYYRESELQDGQLCPIHETPAELVSEPSYFFRMSKYQQKLIEYIQEHPDFIVPKTRKNEVMSFLLNNKLADLSISRTSFQWGIPVSGTQEHIMYVWVDALVNYISSLGGIETEEFKRFWPVTVHFLAKDILRFHAVYWPCMLFSANIPLPKRLVVHGWWTIQNRKISKSNPATRVDPMLLAEIFSSDGLRYFLLEGTTLGHDGDLVYENVIDTLNTDLANKLGNLVSRVTKMAQRYLDGIITPLPDAPKQELDAELEKRAYETADAVAKNMESYNPSAALKTVISYVSWLNVYLDKTAPWTLAKKPEGKERSAHILAQLIEALRWVSIIGYPFFPNLSLKIRQQIGVEEPMIWPILFQPTTRTVQPDDILFQKLDLREVKDLLSSVLLSQPPKV
jgi:methionyl-tRNA synthetase